MSSPSRVPAQRPAPQVRRPRPPAITQPLRQPSQRVLRARTPVQPPPLIVRGNLVIARPAQQAPQPVQQVRQNPQPVQQAPFAPRMLTDEQRKRKTALEEQLKKVKEWAFLVYRFYYILCRSENKKKYSRECGICYHPNPIERSVTSVCGHTYCTRCMIRQEQTEGIFTGRIDCPFCRKRTTYTKLFEVRL